MVPGKFEIRQADESNILLLKEWANLEHWNPGVNDIIDCFYQTDKTGFFLGYLDDEPIASISAVKHGDSFGFISYYIVKPAFRGQGYGILLFRHALAHLEGRNVGLDGVEEQQANYVKTGFTVHYNHMRYQGVGTGNADSVELSFSNGRIIPLDVDDTTSVNSLIKYDSEYFGCERPVFLRTWFQLPGSRTFFATATDGSLQGFGSIRPAVHGYRIGPLYAETEEVVNKLLGALLSTVSAHDAVYLDVADTNPSAVTLVEQRGWLKVATLGRMNTKGAVLVPFHAIYGVASFELG